MIIRLYAMYQRSRRVLVFLCVIFLAFEIASIVIIVIQMESWSGSELHHRFQTCVPLTHQTHISRVCLFRCSSVQYQRGLGQHAFVKDDVGIGYCMGDPRIVSCCLDRYKTLPWTPTSIDRMGGRGLFHHINWNSCVLLRKVGPWFEYDYPFSLEFRTSFLAISCIQLIFLSPKMMVC
jgi:hypothetical protein